MVFSPKFYSFQYSKNGPHALYSSDIVLPYKRGKRWSHSIFYNPRLLKNKDCTLMAQSPSPKTIAPMVAQSPYRCIISAPPPSEGTRVTYCNAIKS